MIEEIKIESLKIELQNYLKELALREDLKQLASSLKSDLFVVGGAIRNAYYENLASDLDLGVELDINRVVESLTEKNIKFIPTGLKHFTVTVVLANEVFELSSFRTEDQRNFRGVSFGGTLRTDLELRDFTINSLAFNLNTKKLYGLKSSIEDLSKKIVRTCSQADKVFSQDPLRILRMVRFGAADGFSIETKTLESATELAQKLKTVSIERVRDEFSKILLSDRPDAGLTILQRIGFFKDFIEEVEQFVGYYQNRFHKSLLFEHTLEVVSKTPKDLILRLSALLHDVGKPYTMSINPNTNDRNFFKHETVGAEIARDILKRFIYPEKIIDSVERLVKTHMRPIECGDGGIRRLIRDTDSDFSRWRILKEADASSCLLDYQELKRRLSIFDEQVESVRKGPELSPLKSLKINGDDLLNLGIEKGKRIGVILRALHEEVLDNPLLNEKDYLLKRAKEMVSL